MNTKNTGLLAIAIIVVMGVGLFIFSFKGKEQSPIAPATSTTKSSSTLEAHYKDGEYKQEGIYVSPAGQEQIDVDISIKGGIITEAAVTPKAENPKSKYMQGVFVENYKQLVIGKNIKDLKLGKVAGSSLTPQGFNDALEKIKVQAKS